MTPRPIVFVLFEQKPRVITLDSTWNRRNSPEPLAVPARTCKAPRAVKVSSVRIVDFPQGKKRIAVASDAVADAVALGQ